MPILVNLWVAQTSLYLFRKIKKLKIHHVSFEETWICILTDRDTVEVGLPVEAFPLRKTELLSW